MDQIGYEKRELNKVEFTVEQLYSLQTHHVQINWTMYPARIPKEFTLIKETQPRFIIWNRHLSLTNNRTNIAITATSDTAADSVFN